MSNKDADVTHAASPWLANVGVNAVNIHNPTPMVCYGEAVNAIAAVSIDCIEESSSAVAVDPWCCLTHSSIHRQMLIFVHGQILLCSWPGLLTCELLVPAIAPPPAAVLRLMTLPVTEHVLQPPRYTAPPELSAVLLCSLLVLIHTTAWSIAETAPPSAAALFVRLQSVIITYGNYTVAGGSHCHSMRESPHQAASIEIHTC